MGPNDYRNRTVQLFEGDAPVTRRASTLLLSTAALVGLLALPAAAHVTANPNHAPAEGYIATSLRVGHGCGDAATVEVAVRMPSGVLSATPEQLPGWAVETVMGELDEPYDSHGETVTEGVREVVWTAEPGNELDAHQYRDFGLSLRLSGEPGETLYFPTVQTCTEGENAWIEIPDTVEEWDTLDSPAPYVTLSAAADGSADAADASSDEAEAVGASTSDADAAVAAADDETSGVMTWAALVLGLIGAVAGVGALMVARRR